ncbi:hypothetical protein Avbf_16862 [Armadillidium vulgare]|nr:hypothetical protein Avbf_16862 [Armadillidium vulgare]
MQLKGTTSVLDVLHLILYTFMLLLIIQNYIQHKTFFRKVSKYNNISLREDWFFECLAQARITNIVEKISFRIDVFEKIAPWVLSSSNVSLEGTEIRVKSPFPFFIACYVEGRPKPKITWLKDGEKYRRNY